MASLTTITAGMTGAQFISAVNGNDGNLNAAIDAVQSYVYNALDYNIVPNDDEVDNATAIQALIDDITATGGTIYFPPGTYYMRAITVPDTVCLMGDPDVRQTIFRAFYLFDGSLVSIIHNFDLSPRQPGGIQYIHLIGTSSTGVGLYMECSLFSIKGVTISGFATYALQMHGTLVGQFMDCIFVGSGASGIGVYADQNVARQIYADEIFFVQCEFYSAYGWAVKIMAGAQVAFQRCVFEVNGTPDVADSGCIYHVRGEHAGGLWHGILIEDCWFEANRGTVLHFEGYDGQTHYHSISNTVFHNNNSSGGLTMNVNSVGTNRYQVVALRDVIMRQETNGIILLGSNAKVVNNNSSVEGAIVGTGYYTVTPTLVQ